MGRASRSVSAQDCFTIALIILCTYLTGCATKWSCNCGNVYHGLQIEGFCLRSGLFINKTEFCTNFHTFPITNFPYSAVSRQLSCDINDNSSKFFIVYFHDDDVRIVLLGTPIARHKLSDNLFVACDISPQFTRQSVPSTNETDDTESHEPETPFKEEFNQTYHKKYRGECNDIFDDSQLRSQVTSPFTVSKLSFDINGHVITERMDVVGQTFIVLVNFPRNNSADVKMVSLCPRNLICSLNVKSVTAEADFRTRFTILKDRVVVAQWVNFGFEVSRTLESVEIGNYSCKIEVMYKACSPFADINDSVYAKYEVKSMEFRNCTLTTTEPEEAQERNVSTYFFIIVTVTALIVLIGMMVLLHRKMLMNEIQKRGGKITSKWLLGYSTSGPASSRASSLSPASSEKLKAYAKIAKAKAAEAKKLKGGTTTTKSVASTSGRTGITISGTDSGSIKFDLSSLKTDSKQLRTWKGLKNAKLTKS